LIVSSGNFTKNFNALGLGKYCDGNTVEEKKK